MAKVRGRDTSPELRVRKVLHRAGYRFRLHRADLPGKPDIYLPQHKVAVFVHGCFWHGHDDCKRATIPATRTEFWFNKIETNKRRDIAARDALTRLGIRVVTLWQCELRDEQEILRHFEGKQGSKASDVTETTSTAA